MKITTEDIPLSEALHLRHRLLRPDKQPNELMSAADTSPLAIHLAALLNGNRVGMLSAGPEPCPFKPFDGSWRLRGLAVAESARRKGVATALLRSIIVEAYSRGACALWGKTRVGAVSVHTHLGFETIGEEYDIPPAGLHSSTFLALTNDLALPASGDAGAERLEETLIV